MAIALYARKSVERENSISCETQLAYCRAMLKPDEHGETIYEFVDNGFSGGNLEREGFREMMSLVERGGISKVIVYRLDRISRSLVDFVSIMERFKKYNVAFISSQESFDTSTSYGEMITKLLMVFAEFERQSIIERVTHAYQARSDQGIFMGGRRPYGFTFGETVIHGVKTKKFLPLADEISHVRYIFERYAVPNVTLRRLLEDLLQNGILLTEGKWSTAKLSAMIRNPIYVRADNAIYEYFRRKGTKIVSDIYEFDGTRGIQLYGKTKHDSASEDWSDMKIVVMSHEGVIDSELWLSCQKKVAKNKKINNSMSNTTSWLGGRIVCQKCGRTMTVTKGGKRADGSQTRYFSCTGKQNRICEGIGITLYADSLEDMIYTLISEKFRSMKTCSGKAESENTGKINALKNKKIEIEDSQNKLVELMMSSAIETDMMKLLNERAKALAEEKRRITEQIAFIANTERDAQNTIDLSEEWKTADYEKKKSVVQLLIDKIYIAEDGAVEVVWNI
ncbi:MAG: recombinase family protein [Ruminococcaceae bacterium]|nr:recombinase family protein [Oscillospiraceae bacterium]